MQCSMFAAMHVPVELKADMLEVMLRCSREILGGDIGVDIGGDISTDGISRTYFLTIPGWVTDIRVPVHISRRYIRGVEKGG